MRSSFTLTCVLSLALCHRAASAQNDEINPRMLTEQIREQQRVVETVEGRTNGNAWLKLAVLLQDGGQYQASETAYERALQFLQPCSRAVLADALDHMGTMYVESGQVNKAEPLEREALSTREAENDMVGSGVSHMHLAALLLKKGEARRAEAEATIAASLLVPEQTGAAVRRGVTPEQKMTALINLSLIRCELNACLAVLPDLRFASSIAHENYSDKSLPVGYIDFLLGYAFWKAGNLESAAKLMGKGTRELAAVFGWSHPAYLGTLMQYREFLIQAKLAAEAKKVEAEIEKLNRSTS